MGYDPLKMVWVMGYRRDYGFLLFFSGNQVGGCRKVWVTGEYGLSQIWIILESTVVSYIL